MSVIIKGMKLPKNCDNCDLIQFDDEGLEAHCPLSPYYRWCGTPPDYRPEGCPLVEIRAPHGRLIDADKAATSISMMNNHPCGNSIETVNDVVEWLRFANDSGNNIAFPTIIEAEEK